MSSSLNLTILILLTTASCLLDKSREGLIRAKSINAFKISNTEKGYFSHTNHFNQCSCKLGYIRSTLKGECIPLLNQPNS
jgi:hypothetical protein